MKPTDGRGAQYLSVVVRSRIKVLKNDRLPIEFKVSRGLMFHLKFGGESHPASIRTSDNAIVQGAEGDVVIEFTGLAEEAERINVGLPLTLVGGLDLKFGEGLVTEVVEKREVDPANPTRG